MTTWRVQRLPHDTLWRLALYHAHVIETKMESGDRTGLSYEGMSAITALAFSVEALLNFVGQRKLRDEWNERASYARKIKALEARLDFTYSKADEPFRTLEELKVARDSMAHGKPADFEVVVTTEKEVAAAMQPEWSPLLAPERVLASVAQVAAFKDLMFKRARIKPGAQFTSAMAEGE